MNYFRLRFKQLYRRLDRRLDRRLLPILIRLFDKKTEAAGIHFIGGNAIRFSILTALMAGTLCAAVISSCKSRYGFTNQEKQGASGSKDGIAGALPPVTAPGSKPPVTTPPSTAPESPDTNPQTEPVPTVEGGPVAGIEAWQNGKMVDTLVTGVEVAFKMTAWTHDTSETTGCDTHKGIVQASWGIGSRPAEDIQRLAGQECRSFDYTGTFVKPGSISVTLDVISGDGEQAHAKTSYPVVGNAVVISDPPPPGSPTVIVDPLAPGNPATNPAGNPATNPVGNPTVNSPTQK
jgi:hypothetical protein